MNSPEATEELRAELQTIEADLAGARSAGANVRQQIGDLGPEDSAAVASLVTMAEEQEAFAAALEARRERVLGQLDGKASAS